jgi:hypothetical protein
LEHCTHVLTEGIANSDRANASSARDLEQVGERERQRERERERKRERERERERDLIS